MHDIQTKIRDYMDGDTVASEFNLRCFVGMIQTGEATLDNFRVVGGDSLMAAVRDHADLWRD